MNTRAVERISLFLVRYLFWPVVQLICATGGAVAVTASLVMHAARLQASAAICNDGPSPTSMQSGNMPQAKLTTYYNRVFMKHLTKTLFHMRMCTMMTLPEKSGQIFRNFMQLPLGPNLVQQLEGTIGNPITVTTLFQDIILSQLTDYLNFSDKSFLTSISDDLTNYRKNLAYRLALSIDDIVMVNFDYLRTLDPKTGNQDSITSPYPFTKQIIEQMPASLLGQDVKPMEGGYFRGKIHPFFVGDLTALDNAINSLVDIMKHTSEGQMKLTELTDSEGEDGVSVMELFGCRWMQSTNCTQTPNYNPSAGVAGTALSTYLAGEDAMVFINFPHANGTGLADGKWQNMTLWAGEYNQGNSYDPARVIAAGTSYNCMLGVGVPPDPTSRARIALAVPQTT